MKGFIFPLTLLAAVALVSCDKPAGPNASATPIPEPVAQTKTLETSRLASAIDSYQAAPTADHAADVKQAMAALDGEIAELEARVAKNTGGERDEAAAKLRNLQSYRDTQSARFAAMRASEPATVPAGVDARSGAEKTEDRAREVGGKIEDGAKRAGEALQDAGQRAKEAIHDATR